MTDTAVPARDASTVEALGELLLAMADDEFTLGFWDSEWTGIAPMLEEDVAMSSIAQDEIGHAKALYELLASLTDADADAIAFGRQPDEYRHATLMNHRRTDWAFSIARRFLYDTADAVRLDALSRSANDTLAQLATKMRREESYHLMHMQTWLRRLGDGTARPRLLEALERLWLDAQTVFSPLRAEARLIEAGILPVSLEVMRRRWLESIEPPLAAVGFTPTEPPAPGVDGRTRRTEDFGWLWSQFTMVYRSEEGARW